MKSKIENASEVKNSSSTSTLAHETRKNVLMIGTALICGIMLTGCGSKPTTDDNTELEDIEQGQTEITVKFQKVDPAPVPYEITFVNTSDEGVAYLWDFGDGDTSDQKEPTHTYIHAGIYCVALTVWERKSEEENEKPQMDKTFTFTDYVIVKPLPSEDTSDTSSQIIADFDAVNFGYSSCLQGKAVVFINLSKNAAAYIWEFGDGYVSSEREPVHNYMEAGTYNVTLTISFRDEDYYSLKTITKPVEITIDE